MVFRIIGMAPLTMLRVIPILHHLGSSCRHAASIDVSARTIRRSGAAVVVRIVLIPSGFQQKHILFSTIAGNESSVLPKRTPIVDDRLTGNHISALGTVRIDTIQKILQSRGHVVTVKDTFLGISNYRSEIIVGRNDYKSSFSNIEDIKRRLGIHHDKRRTLPCKLKISLNETLSQRTGFIKSNRIRLCSQAAQKQYYDR